jgi:hypothetical protein
LQFLFLPCAGVPVFWIEIVNAKEIGTKINVFPVKSSKNKCVGCVEHRT